MNRLHRLAWIFILCVSAIHIAVAQEVADTQSETDPALATSSEDDLENLPPSTWAAGDRPEPVTRIIRGKKKKVFPALLRILEQMEIPVTTADFETGLVNTELIEYSTKRRWGNLATRPVDITRERPILQRQGLNSGKFSVSATLVKKRRKTEIVMSVYLEEHARHLTINKRIWVERYSNGKLEGMILDRLEPIFE